MESRVIQPSGVATASPHYSPAILTNGGKMLFISGQGPRNLDADPETQIRETFEQIGAILKEAGAGWGNVVMMRSYFMNMERDLEAFRRIRQDFLMEPFPASTAVGVTELAVENLQIEIEAVAVL
jgi:enamine deaminase RidA (YjgF/YER057c/UK114 family)